MGRLRGAGGAINAKVRADGLVERMQNVGSLY